MKTASLFAGIGGFDMAFRRRGMSSALVSEIHPKARAVLASQFPEARLDGDSTTVDLHGIDLVTLGFPCQGISSAAVTRKHRGLQDEASKSYVIWSALDRVAEAGVPFVLLENGSTLTTKAFAADLALLKRWFKKAGYDAAVYVLNAACYGARMRRERSFILARRGRQMPWPKVGTGIEFTCANPVLCVSGQQGGTSWCLQPSPARKSRSYTLVLTKNEVRYLTPEGQEKLFGFPAGHTLAAGMPSSRYELLGNAVSVDSAAAALSLLLDGKEPAMMPPTDTDPLAHTRLSAGGASGQCARRIWRTLNGSRKSTNQTELQFALAVYAQAMARDPSAVNEEQALALKGLEGWGLVRSPSWLDQNWPAEVTVVAKQRGRID